MGRTRTLFDGGWRFLRGEIHVPGSIKSGMLGGLADVEARKSAKHLVVAFVDKEMKKQTDPDKWPEVTLPHDWCVEGGFVRDEKNATQGYTPRGVGFYRKVFDLPESARGRRVVLEFDGVFRDCTVWLNGHRLAGHASGYTSFRVDITDTARYGDEGMNCILVRVDGTQKEGWWYEGCGIYRHVWLTVTHPVHVAPWGLWARPRAITKKRASVRIETEVMNETGKAVGVRVECEVSDPRGRRIGKRTAVVSLAPGASGTAIVEMPVVRPALWSTESPSLYRASARVLVNGRAVDGVSTTFGIRTIRFDANRGFFLNGVHTPLKGTCNHQDFAGVGCALPDSLHEYKIRVLKELGSNAYRCAHNPPAPELLDACDRLGMLVMDENRKLDSSPTGLEDLASMIRRDRNHPSVIMWSMENEEPLEGTRMGARIVETMVRLAHSLDPDRPTVSAQNHGHGENGYTAKLDIAGLNYGHNNDKDLHFHRRFPRQPLTATESNATTTTRGIYHDDPKRGYANAYGTNVWKPPYTWNTGFFIPWQSYMKHPCLTGVFVWAGFDYRGEPTPYRWPTVITNYGILDLCGFPKDGAWHHRAMWTAEPVLHLMPHWNRPVPASLEGGKVKVWALTNCSRVELFLNGRPLGSRDVPPGGCAEWMVAWEPGRLSARGYRDGVVAATAAVETTGAPAAVVLEPDRTRAAADGRDAVPVRVSIVDARGRVVPDANPVVRFSPRGPARNIGVANGDPSCHDPEKAGWRRAFNGHCMIVLQSAGKPGTAVLTARAPGLRPGRTRIAFGRGATR